MLYSHPIPHLCLNLLSYSKHFINLHLTVIQSQLLTSCVVCNKYEIGTEETDGQVMGVGYTVHEPPHSWQLATTRRTTMVHVTPHFNIKDCSACNFGNI